MIIHDPPYNHECLDSQLSIVPVGGSGCDLDLQFIEFHAREALIQLLNDAIEEGGETTVGGRFKTCS